MKYVYLIWTMPVKYFVRARSVTSKHISFVLELFSQEMSVHEEFLQEPAKRVGPVTWFQENDTMR